MKRSASTAPSDSTSAAAPWDRISESVMGVGIIIDGVEYPNARKLLSALEDSSVGSEEDIAFQRNCRREMECIQFPDSLLVNNVSNVQDLLRLCGVYDGVFSPYCDAFPAFFAWVGGILIVQQVRPSQLHKTVSDLTLDRQLSLCLQTHPHLGLIVEGPIETAIVEVEAHGRLVEMIIRDFPERGNRLLMEPAARLRALLYSVGGVGSSGSVGSSSSGVPA